jgi:hypothetical protein
METTWQHSRASLTWVIAKQRKERKKKTGRDSKINFTFHDTIKAELI